MRCSAIVTVTRSAARGVLPAVGRRGALAAGAAVALAVAGAWLPVSASASTSSPARPAQVTLEFGYVGPHEQYVTVPAGVHLADVRIVGGHGGRSLDPYREVEGGDGAGRTTDTTCPISSSVSCSSPPSRDRPAAAAALTYRLLVLRSTPACGPPPARSSPRARPAAPLGPRSLIPPGTPSRRPPVARLAKIKPG